eukprot:325962_1
MNVYSMQGIVDVDWQCIGTHSGTCSNSFLFCGGIDQNIYSVEWDFADKQWQYLVGYCSTLEPTYDPTVEPTSPTLQPTNDPTTDPTTDPTNQPTPPTAHPTNDPTTNP